MLRLINSREFVTSDLHRRGLSELLALLQRFLRHLFSPS